MNGWCRMDRHYLGKVEVDGEWVVLEEFPAFTKFANIVSEEDEAGAREAFAEVMARVATMERTEQRAWLVFLQSMAQQRRGE